MTFLGRVRSSVVRVARTLGRRRRLESDLDEELRLHVDLQTAENVRRGMSVAQGRRAALVTFGGVEKVKEECRDNWSARFVEALAQDVRYAVRGLRRSPVFAATVVLTLGLGIGANTAMFSVVDAVLLKPLPYARGEQVVVLRQPDVRSGIADLGFSVQEVKDYRQLARTLDSVVEYHSMNFTLLGGGQPRRVRAGVVSWDFFGVLRVEPVLGRAFRPEDEAPGAEAVLLLSHEYWRELGGDAGIVGRHFEMNDRVHTVVGVLPPVPQYPATNDVYMPSSACPFRNRAATIENRQARMLNAFARVRAGTTLESAQADVLAVGLRLREQHPDAYPADAQVQPSATLLKEDLVRDARPTFLVLLATVALVLLIACANVANLALARLIERGRELAVRSALGAGRGRLVTQLVTESMLLTLAGGVLGLLLAFVSLDVLARFAARFTPRATEIAIDGRVLAFTLVASVLTGILVGVLPGLPRAGRLSETLVEGSNRTTGGRARRRLRAGLVAWQLALSFMLLIGAALMLRSFAHLQAVDAGFRSDHVLTTAIDLNFSTYSDPEHRIDVERVLAFHRGLYDRLRETPGVVSAGAAWTFPLNSGFQNDGTFEVEGQAAGAARPTATFVGVSPDYFSTIGTPLLRGRAFDDHDRVGGAGVLVVNQRLARHQWGGEDPIGRRISTDRGKTWRTVVGVVGDVRQAGLDREPGEAIYLPFTVFPGYSATLFVRTLDDPQRLESVVRAAAAALDPETAVSSVRTLDQIRDESLASPRLTTVLLGLFASLALLITAAGLSGLIQYSVSQRTREIGIRMAMGADRASVLAMILREGLGSVALGLGLGIVGALGLSRLVGGILFGVAPTDPLCFVGSATVLLLAAAAACLAPARRATAIQPMVALRAE